MLKVLIAEDEMLVRIGLKNSIDWERLGMTVIADVANGQAAWEVYEKMRPDLVLTDIRMPIMDGIQLIERIREQDQETKIVILTVYEEFELVRKSLHLGVSDYILKLKMSIEEMESVLRKIQAESRTEKAKMRSDAGDARQNAVQLKENAVKDYLFYGRYTEPEFAELAASNGFRLQPGRLVVCVMAIDKFEQMENKFKDNHGNLIRFSILNIVTELLDGYNRGEVVHEKDEKYMLLLSFADAVSEQNVFRQLHEMLSHIQTVMKTYLNATVTFGISSLNNGFAALKTLHGECLAALELRYFLGNERLIRWEASGADRIRDSVRRKLRTAVDGLEPFHERYRKEMEESLEEFLRAERFFKADVGRLLIRWIHWPTVNLNVYAEDVSVMALDYAGRIHRSETLDETLAAYADYFAEVKRYQQSRRSLSKEIAEAVKYIQQRYDQDISLQQIADHVQLSASYLSSLFKKELQFSFVEYLNHYRIDMAKELLVNTHLKSYQIAQKVGYMDDSYFSRIFKKTTSMRPNEFRRQWYVENGDDRRDADDGSLE